jgi:hypothetical protein
MGYMGLANWGASDGAASATYRMQGDMVKRLRGALRGKGNTYNLSGAVNVALIVESFITPIAKQFKDCDDLLEVLRVTHDKLANEIMLAKEQAWNNESNKRTHIKAYWRLLRSLQKSIQAIK